MPSVVQSVEISKKKAIFKEDIQILSQVFTDMVQSGYDPNISIVANLAPKLNATKVCDTDIVAQGCMRSAPTGVNFSPAPHVGFLMPNKSVFLFRREAVTPDMFWLFVDYNGEKTDAQMITAGSTGDTMVLEYNLREVRAERDSVNGSGFLNPGQVKPFANHLLTMGFFNTL